MTPKPTVLHADLALARRLEALCANEMRRFVRTARALDPPGAADWMEVAGGVAAYVGANSPVNAACGLGMSGPVSAADVAAVERFFFERDAHPLANVCPLSHPSFITTLGERGWVPDGFEHALVRPIDPHEVFATTPEGVEIRLAETAEDRRLWALVAATGFSDPLPPLDEQVALGSIVVERPGSQLFLAWVDGKVAGTGEMYVEDGVAWLSADTTLPQFRGRGVQQALQRYRLALAAEAGCALAATETAPGSGSQRNMERVGFRIAYTRVDFVVRGEARSAERTAE